MANAIVTAVCKSARSVGYPKKKERALEARVSEILKHEGPAGVVSHYKALQQCKMDAFQNDRPRDWRWIRHSRSGKSPYRRADRECWELSDTKFFRVTGAVIMSVDPEVSAKQITSWYRDMSASSWTLEDVRSSINQASRRDQESIRAIFGTDSTEVVDTAWYQQLLKGGRRWDKIALDLIDQYANNPGSVVFTPADVTKTSIPIGDSLLNLGQYRTEEGVVKTSHDALLNAYNQSRIYAPRFLSKDMELDANVFRFLDVKSGKKTDYDDPSKSEGYFSYYSNLISESRNNTPDANNNVYGVPAPRTLPDRNLRSDSTDEIVGQISFLHKPGMKARVVANPNRRVQNSLTPLGKAIQNVVYNDPYFKDHVFVENQDKGRLVVLDRLRRQLPTASVDLHAATDTMSVDRVYDITGLNAWRKVRAREISDGKDILQYARFEQQKQYYLTDMEKNPDKYQDLMEYFHSKWAVIGQFVHDHAPAGTAVKFESNDATFCVGCYLLDQKLRLFDRVRQASWRLNTPVSTPVDYASFKKGQPLGTRPSFPLLTFANATMAELAVTASHSSDTFYGIVGDDAIMAADAYPIYRAGMTHLLGSTVNDDKTLLSSNHAEFVGYLMDSKGRLYPKKPHVSANVVNNAIKFGTDVSWLKSLISDARKGMLIGVDNLSSVPQPDLPLNKRVGSDIKPENLNIGDQISDWANDSTPEKADDYHLSGKQVAKHTAALRNVDINQAWRQPESALDEIHYNLNISFFNHHKMREEVVRDSMTQFFRKKLRAIDIAKQLTSSETALVPLDDGRRVLLVDTDGNGAVFSKDSDRVEDVKISIPALIKRMDGQDHLKPVYSRNQVLFRQGLLKTIKPATIEVTRPDSTQPSNGSTARESKASDFRTRSSFEDGPGL